MATDAPCTLSSRIESRFLPDAKHLPRWARIFAEGAALCYSSVATFVCEDVSVSPSRWMDREMKEVKLKHRAMKLLERLERRARKARVIRYAVEDDGDDGQMGKWKVLALALGQTNTRISQDNGNQRQAVLARSEQQIGRRVARHINPLMTTIHTVYLNIPHYIYLQGPGVSVYQDNI